MGEVITMSHGSGGRLMHRLIADLFQEAFGKGDGDDAARLPAPAGPLAFSVDGFVIKPLEFPGGDVGKLAVCGTVNDLAAAGARPEWFSASFILEEGLEIDLLRRVVASMARTAREAGVKVVTGDTKVVERGAAEGLFITTSGVGPIYDGTDIRGDGARPGDFLVVTGTVADHGAAVMMARQGLELSATLQSDCAPLAGLVGAALTAGLEIHAMRDPTRGGLATTLVEIAGQSRVRIFLEEERVPLAPPVRQACDLLGLDPLYVANEGKMIVVLPPGEAGPFLEIAREHPYGRQAAVVGRVEGGEPGVVLETTVGGRRPLVMLEGDPLPRIC